MIVHRRLHTGERAYRESKGAWEFLISKCFIIIVIIFSCTVSYLTVFTTVCQLALIFLLKLNF
jgi:hypothetical protein